MSDIRDFCCDVCEGTGHHAGAEIDHDGSEGLWFDPSRRCEYCNGRGYVFEPVEQIDIEDLPPPYPNSRHSDVKPGAAIARSPRYADAAPVSYFETNFPLAQTLPSKREGCGGGSSAITPSVDDRSAPRTREVDDDYDPSRDM